MAAHRGWRDQADSPSDTTKMLLMLGPYMNNK
jgi:amidase